MGKFFFDFFKNGTFFLKSWTFFLNGTIFFKNGTHFLKNGTHFLKKWDILLFFFKMGHFPEETPQKWDIFPPKTLKMGHFVAEIMA